MAINQDPATSFFSSLGQASQGGMKQSGDVASSFFSGLGPVQAASPQVKQPIVSAPVQRKNVFDEITSFIKTPPIQKVAQVIGGLDFKKIGESIKGGAKALPGQGQQAAGIIIDNIIRQKQATDTFLNPIKRIIGVTAPEYKIDKQLKDIVLQKAKEIREAGVASQKAAGEAYAKTYKPSEGLQKYIEMAAFNLPQVAASTGLSLATTLLTKNPALGTALGLSTSYGLGASEVYNEARNNGQTDKQALPLSVLGGTIIGAFDFVPLERLLRKTGAVETVKKSIIKKVASGIVSLGTQSGFEGITEGIQEVVGNAIERTYNEHQDLFEGIKESAIVGALLGGVSDVTLNGVIGITNLKSKNIETKVEKALSTPENERTEEEKEIVRTLTTQELTPDEAISYVVENDLGKTELGKKIMLTAVEAKKTEGKIIRINPAKDEKSLEITITDPTPLPSFVSPEREAVASGGEITSVEQEGRGEPLEITSLEEEATKRGYTDKNIEANIANVKDELEKEMYDAKQIMHDIGFKYVDKKINTKNITQSALELMTPEDKAKYEEANRIFDKNVALLKISLPKKSQATEEISTVGDIAAKRVEDLKSNQISKQEKEMTPKELAKELVESKTQEEIEEKLQKIFGTYEELQQLEDIDTYEKPDSKLAVADDFMGDLERAVKDRDYGEAESILKSVYKRQKKLNAIKTDLKIEYATNLSLKDDVIQKKFGRYLEEHYQEARKIYKEHFGKVLNTDNARELSPDYAPGGINAKDQETKDARSTYAAAVHEPSSAFIKKMFIDDLNELVAQGKQPDVFFTAGGTGSGKSTAIKDVPRVQALYDRADIIYDTNLNKIKSAVDKFNEIFNRNGYIDIAYVHRSPLEALVVGSLPRAMRFGRTVPMSEHIRTHVGAPETLQKIKKMYENDPRVAIAVINNTRGKGNAVEIPDKQLLDFIKQVKYNETDLKTSLEKALEEEYAKGQKTNYKEGINKSVYEGTRRDYNAPVGEKSVQEKVRGIPEDHIGRGKEPQRERPARRVITSKEQPQGTGTAKYSRLYERVKETLGAEYEAKHVTYNELSLEKQAKAVVDLITESPQKAAQIANGIIEPPPGMTQNAVAVGLADLARASGDFKTASDLWTKVSLRITRLGQEIVSLRGSFSQNETLNAVKRILDMRMDQALKRYKDVVKGLSISEGATTIKKVDALIDHQAKKLKKELKNQQIRIQSAQEIINALRCKI